MATKKAVKPLRNETLSPRVDPTFVCSHTQGNVTVQTRLFGPMTPERIATAKAETTRRADMIQPYVPLTDNDTYKRFQQMDRGRDRRGFRDDYNGTGEFIGEDE